MIKPLYPIGRGRRRRKKADTAKRKPLPREVREQMFNRWIIKLRLGAVGVRKKISPELTTDLIGSLSGVIPAKAASYVQKLNSGESFSISILKANITVVPDGFLDKIERKSVERFLKQFVSPSRQVMTFSEFKNWALPEIDFITSGKSAFLSG